LADLVFLGSCFRTKTNKDKYSQQAEQVFFHNQQV
jgi:thiamine monophosphate synthase